MKAQSLLILTPFILFNSCSFKHDGKNGVDGLDYILPGKTISGTGEMQTKNFNLNFDELKVSSGINAEIIKAEQENIVISGPEDLLQEILVDKDGDEVHIHFKPDTNIRNAERVKAVVYAKDFSEVAASSSANIIIKDKFTQDKTKVKVSSSGSISGDLEANDFTLDVSSSGDFKGKIWAINFSAGVSSSGDAQVSGSSTNAEIQVSSSGKLDGRNFNVKKANLQASSSGDILIKVANELNAAASSSGDISVQKTGDLNTQNKSQSSGGSIQIQ